MSIKILTHLTRNLIILPGTKMPMETKYTIQPLKELAVKKILSCLICFSSSIHAFNFDPPEVLLSFPASFPSTVFYGEAIRIPIQMDYKNLKMHKYWVFPPQTTLEITNGICPFFANDENTYPLGNCTLNLIIPGSSMGKIVAGNVSYIVYGRERVGNEDHSWNFAFNSPNFHVTVIPHALAMLPMPAQEATVNHAFIYNLRSQVDYYDQNADAGKKAQGMVSPMEQQGLGFDEDSFSIIGKPERAGTYIFKVGVKNANGTAQPTDLIIHVNENPKDKPYFKPQLGLPSCARFQKYNISLTDLIEPQPGFTTSNQISFRIAASAENSSWLHIPKDNASRLEGEAPKNLEGDTLEITLIAASNTGADSEPQTVHIPIAKDPGQRPFMEYFKITQYANTSFSRNLSGFVVDPAQDGSLKILLDKVEPSAPWLKIAYDNPTLIEGTIPADAAGKTYHMTLRANNVTGGSSIPIIADLKIT